MSGSKQFSKNDPDIRSSYMREKAFHEKILTTSHLTKKWSVFLWMLNICIMYFLLFAEGVAMLLEFYVKMPFYLEEPVEFFGTFYYFSTHVSGIIKFWGIRYKWRKLLELEEIMARPSFHKQSVLSDQAMLAFHRTQDLIGNFIRGACLFCVASYASIPIFETEMIGDTLPISGTFLIEKDHWYVAYALQIGGIFFGALTNATADAMSICLMRTAAKRIDIFKLELSQLKKADEDTTVKWVKHQVYVHHEILKAVETIEDTLHITALSQFINSVVVISCTGLQMMTVPIFSGFFFSLLTYLMAMMTQLVVYNWYGNEVYIKSTEIGTAIYMSEWYECSPQIRKYLITIMERAKRPSQFTLGKFIVLYVPTLGRVLQSSYSYLLALKQTMIRNT